MLNIAILGYGVVGSGVVEVIRQNKDVIFKQTKDIINLKYILDRRDFSGDPIEKYITKDFNDILNDESVKIIIEVMGGTEPAYEFVKSALQNGKHVVTSNKELVAKHGVELLKIAKDKNINFMFEASVGGGIPIIRNILQCLIGDEILEVKGILNGTTNYILTKMASRNESFETALAGAKQKGYAEKDPTNDIDGHDTARKIAILWSLVSGKFVDFNDFITEGISKVNPEDIDFAEATGGVIKLIAVAKKHKNGTAIKVSPVIISEKNLMASVNNAFNAVSISGSCMEKFVFYGPGAGKLPTATAILADIIDIIKNIDKNIGYFWSADKLQLQSHEEVPENFVVRVSFKEKNSSIEQINSIFDNIKIFEHKNYPNQLAFLTEKTTLNDLVFDLDRLKSAELEICSTFIFER